MNKGDFEALSNLRILEAKILLEHSCFSGAYYLAGYAVECALKACICKQIKAYDFPDRDLTNSSYSHDLGKLLQTALLSSAYEREKRLNSILERNWATVRKWSEQKRYDRSVSQQDAQNLYDAITDQTNGVLQWIKTFW